MHPKPANEILSRITKVGLTIITSILFLGIMVLSFVLLFPSEIRYPPFTPSAVCLVPNVVGFDQAVAENTLVALGLQPVESVQDNPSVAKGAVISQEPAANTRLEPCAGDVVIVISRGAPPKSTESTLVITPTVSKTPNPTLTLQAAYDSVDNQFDGLLKANLAFNKPEQMKKDETTTIELILNPSLSESALATQVVERGGFATSTAEPNVLIAPNGKTVTVETSQIEITPRMKAELKPQDAEAFTVTNMLDAEQVVSSVETTTWRWSVTAKKEGSQTLELVIYQLVKYDGKEFWHEVETYKANIVVEVTLGDRVKSLDWKWIFATLLIPLVAGLWAWWKNHNKKPGVTQVKIVEEKKDTKRKKKEK